MMNWKLNEIYAHLSETKINMTFYSFILKTKSEFDFEEFCSNFDSLQSSAANFRSLFFIKVKI